MKRAIIYFIFIGCFAQLFSHAQISAMGKEFPEIVRAAEADRWDNIKKSLEGRADAEEMCGRLALYFSSTDCGDRVTVERLLDKKADVNNSDPSRGDTALHFAAIWARKDTAELLLERKAEVNKKNILGWTALHKAAFFGHVEVAKFLLAGKAIVDLVNLKGETPLHLAERSGHTAVARLLVAAGTNASDGERKKKT